ncbi:MAG: FHA domain-containing protein [Solirubrobacteraceae bacterium]
MQDPERLHASSPAELRERMEAGRAGSPYLVYRDDGGAQSIFVLPQTTSQLTIGRGPGNEVRIEWDESVSRVHAELNRLGHEWTVVDDGLSRNGCYVNEERLSGRRRLRDGDLLRIGETSIAYHTPAREHGSTVLASRLPAATDLSPAKRRVLIALARPYRDGSAFATPATNQQITDELFLSVEGVKTHLRGLFELFGVQHLPQNEKRATLVERAFLAGVITTRDLAEE